MDNGYLLYGASGHGSVIMDILLSSHKQVIRFVDDNPNISSYQSIEIIRPEDISQFPKCKLIISVGNNSVRKKLSHINSALDYGTAIHPTAIIGSQVSIAQGTVIMPGTVINAGAVIGQHAIINTHATIEHECVIEDYVHISPGAVLSGQVQVGEGTHIGAGAVVRQGIKIGRWSVIGAGAVVVHDIPDNVTVVGNPAKRFLK